MGFRGYRVPPISQKSVNKEKAGVESSGSLHALKIGVNLWYRGTVVLSHRRFGKPSENCINSLKMGTSQSQGWFLGKLSNKSPGSL